MAVLLNRSYAGLLAGTITAMLTSVENALIAQGLASASTKANVTPGNVTANLMSGTVAIPVGANSVTITNNYVDGNTKVFASIAQAAADGTLTSLPRIVPAAGSVTIYGNANATAATIVDWVILATPGLTVAN
jgi:hypothetical protein